LADLRDIHGLQPAQDIGQVLLGVDAATPATDDERVDHGTAPTGIRVANEEPAASADGWNPNGILDRIMPTTGLCRVAAWSPAFCA